MLQYARDLRKAGSDIVVEQDLADAFGRVRLSSEIEIPFRDIVKYEDLRPISAGGEGGSLSDIALKAGAGPTVRHALASENRAYINTVVQLSLLAATQHRQSLAAAISESLEQRLEAKVPNAAPSPGLEGILNSLTSINSQTTLFPRQDYQKRVEGRLREGVPTFARQAEDVKITSPILLGALDAVPLLQSLPQSRRIIVAGRTGCITLIVWMHYVLGLDVQVNGSDFEPVDFGRPANNWFQVIINWNSITRRGKTQSLRGGRRLQHGDSAPTPEFVLQDAEAQVLLRAFAENAGRRQITTTVRHTVKGWATEYLSHVLNKLMLLQDDDPIYRAIAMYATAIAVVVPKHHCRGTDDANELDLPSVPIVIERWRVMAAARVLCDGIEIDEQFVAQVTWEVEHGGFHAANPPNCFHTLQMQDQADPTNPTYQHFMETTKNLACFIIPFAFIADIQQCALMPIPTNDPLFFEPWLERSVDSACKQAADWRPMKEDAVLSFFSDLMREGAPEGTGTNTSGDIFLVSNGDWSVFLDIIGQKDPARVRPELVHIQEGTPTKVATGEQRYFLEDGLRVGFPQPPH